jgi:hypothetical protein
MEGLHTVETISEDTKTVANLFFEDTDKLMVRKLSSLLSQSSVEELLNIFFKSDTTEVCVLLANMQATTCKTINHIRVMIEEAELKTPAQHCKLFVLLLHFPPAQFCYPSLFLKGWDHCYLDTVAKSQLKDVVNIQDWLLTCIPAAEPRSDTLLHVLEHILPSIVSVLSARVYFGNKDKPFNSSMNGTQRSEALKTLLFTKGVDQVLCERFRAYWSPRVMVEYLERAATFSSKRESTLNITDSIQSQFKSLFTDFCVYMITEANKDFNLDTLFVDEDPYIRKLFIGIFRILPVPELQQLNQLSNDLPSLHPFIHHPRFPFFRHVYELMEKQVDFGGEVINHQMDLMTDSVRYVNEQLSYDSEIKLHNLIHAVLAGLEPQLQVSSVSLSGVKLTIQFQPGCDIGHTLILGIENRQTSKSVQDLQHCIYCCVDFPL